MVSPHRHETPGKVIRWWCRVQLWCLGGAGYSSGPLVVQGTALVRWWYRVQLWSVGGTGYSSGPLVVQGTALVWRAFSHCHSRGQDCGVHWWGRGPDILLSVGVEVIVVASVMWGALS